MAWSRSLSRGDATRGKDARSTRGDAAPGVGPPHADRGPKVPKGNRQTKGDGGFSSRQSCGLLPKTFRRCDARSLNPTHGFALPFPPHRRYEDRSRHPAGQVARLPSSDNRPAPASVQFLASPVPLAIDSTTRGALRPPRFPVSRLVFSYRTVPPAVAGRLTLFPYRPETRST
jgi:hypothetical protein